MIVEFRGSRSGDLVEELTARVAGTHLRELALIAAARENGVDAETLLALADLHAERLIYGSLLAAMS